MFITRATRHDTADIAAFLSGQGWGEADLRKGVTFFARDGSVVGCIRLIEVEPRIVVVDDMVVDGARRREGIGSSLMQAAMNSRGGTLYLCCHEENLPFYATLGFAETTPDDLPISVLEYLETQGDHPAPEGHPQHFFMRAR